MMEYVKICFRKYATFSGRARRAEYWYFSLFNFLISILIVFPYYFMLFSMGGVESQSFGVGTLLYLLLLMVVGIAFFLPSLAVTVRRLHDTNQSGWLALIGLVPYVGALVLLYFFVKKGNVGDNQYGPDPKAVEEI